LSTVKPPIPHQPPVLDLTDFKRDLSELTDRLGNAQDCL
jgi:peptide chain release factor 2